MVKPQAALSSPSPHSMLRFRRKSIFFLIRSLDGRILQCVNFFFHAEFEAYDKHAFSFAAGYREIGSEFLGILILVQSFDFLFHLKLIGKLNAQNNEFLSQES